MSEPAPDNRRRLYRYRAVEADGGRRRAGEQAGDSPYAVRATLRRLGLHVEALEEVGGAAPLPRALRPLQMAWQVRQRRRRRMSRADLFDALATMLEAGLPMEQAVSGLATSPVRNTAERHMLQAMREHLRAGAQLSEACAVHPSWFDVMDLAMLRAGQQAGDLPAVLRSLSAYHQAGSALGHRLFTALAYPAFLLLTALAVVVFLSTQTLPQLMEMLVASGRAVPPITQAVTLAGGILARWWWAILAGVILGVAALQQVVRRLPVEGWLAQRLAATALSRARQRARVATVSRVLARLQRSGLPLTEALQTAAAVMRSPALHGLLLHCADAIRAGRDFSAVVARSHVLDPEFAQLLELGEQSGELPTMLDRIADRYERAAARSLDRLTALLEPVAILILAGLIGIVVFAAIAPLLHMTSTA